MSCQSVNNDQSNSLLPKNPHPTQYKGQQSRAPAITKLSKRKMKREGRQHGMVRADWILPPSLDQRPQPRFNRLDSPSTAGRFTKVPAKPTNHSKFTGKCGLPRCAVCHIHPACKSKAKAKGTQKLRSFDVHSNCHMVAWRVVDRRPGLKFAGVSATGILNHLGGDYLDDTDDEGEDCIHTDDVYEGSSVLDGGLMAESCSLAEEKIESGAPEIKADDNDDSVEEEEEAEAETENVFDDDDDDNMSFCEVGFVWEQVDGDEGWCVVGEL